MVRPVLWSAAITLGIVTVAVSAQEPRPRFEVASVKTQPDARVYNPGVLALRVRPGGVFRVSHGTVQGLLMFAYDLREYRIVGGPDWIRNDLFEVDARAGGDASASDVKQMVRALLEDRFGLVAHTEQREMRHQALVLARPDGQFGPNLVRMEECSAAAVNDLRRKYPEKYPMPGGGLVAGFSCAGLGDLAAMLSLGSTPVIDATRLKGGFYFTVLSHLSQWNLAAATMGRAVPASDASVPALPTALEEQLGVRLESRRGAMDVLVIDSVQQPTEN
jgi:uncharacterized protein (TIGR03435 family)